MFLVRLYQLIKILIGEKYLVKLMKIANNENDMGNKRAANKRFGASGGVTSNNLLWGI